MPNLRGSELLILLLIVVLLFGAKRLPDAARGIGRSLRIFKAETKGLAESDAASSDAPAPAPAALPQAQAQSTESSEAPTGQSAPDAQPQSRT